MKKIFLYTIFIFLAGFLLSPGISFAHQPNIIYSKSGGIQINNPETSQAFYDELKGNPRNYFIDSGDDFELFINLLVPEEANRYGRYYAKVFLLSGEKEEQIAELDASSIEWQEYYEPFGRDYYLKGPELSQQILAGKYKIEVYSKTIELPGSTVEAPLIIGENLGKYVLAVGKKESYNIKSVLNIYWQLPLLKVSFFKTPVMQFFLTPFGIGGVAVIGGILIFLAFIYYLVGVIRKFIKHNQAKTLLLTSAGMQMKEEIIKLLQKPAYDVTVAYITTAYKYKLLEDPNYRNKDLEIMKEIGFNVEEVDIDGKKEGQVMKLLELKDIIFVAGGNVFYLLNSMRKCSFEKVIRKLLKQGRVYIGSSAGSMVAGKTIKTGAWKESDKNNIGLKNLKGLNLVPFDIFVHYQPEHAEIIKQKLPDPKKRATNLKILTDDQAILVQGTEVSLIGQGEAVVIN